MLDTEVDHDVTHYNYSHEYLFCNDSGHSCYHANFYYIEHVDLFTLTHRDAPWILTSAIIIFTMQTGFGLLEAGSVHVKNEVNIILKNSLSVVFGGITYWAYGFAFTFGDDPGHAKSDPFIGFGHFFLHVGEKEYGYVLAMFLYELALATTCTSIACGCMVGRTEMISYNVFATCMTFIYSIPAHWIWGKGGFLAEMGAQDIGGSGAVHLVGGVTGLVASVMIGPRQSAFASGKIREPSPSPMKCILGTLMLWWSWLRYTSGSIFIISDIDHWTHAVRGAVNAIISSMGGGIVAVMMSLLLCKYYHKDYPFPYDCGMIVNGVIGSLVAILGSCTLIAGYEAFVIGCVSALMTVPSEILTRKLGIDDPVGIIPTHVACGIWGLLAVGLFVHADESTIEGHAGLFWTGQFLQLGLQLLTAVCFIAWTLVMAFIFFKMIDLTIGLRIHPDDEELGSDLVQHGVGSVTPQETLAAQTVMSITALTKTANDQDMKHSVAKFFKDYFHPKSANDLSMRITQISATGLSLEIRTKGVHAASSHDLGMIKEGEQYEDGERKQPKKVIHVGPTSTSVRTTDLQGGQSEIFIPHCGGRRGSATGMEAGVVAGVC